MTGKKESPARLEEPMQGEISFMTTNKDIQKLSNRQRKVFDLLCAGKYSATDITIRLGYCDPRSYIRDLREKGINVSDEWVENGDTRYKRYWI